MGYRMQYVQIPIAQRQKDARSMYAFVFIVSLVFGMVSAQMLASVSPDDVAALERATKKN
jgi:hypothetical protein